MSRKQVTHSRGTRGAAIRHAHLDAEASSWAGASGAEALTWGNLGQVEDVATGSAAGPAAAYLLQYGFADVHSPVEISQGRYAGRPSKIVVIQDQEGNLLVSGEVWLVSHGVLDMDPVEAGRERVGELL